MISRRDDLPPSQESFIMRSRQEVGLDHNARATAYTKATTIWHTNLQNVSLDYHFCLEIIKRKTVFLTAVKYGSPRVTVEPSQMVKI